VLCAVAPSCRCQQQTLTPVALPVGVAAGGVSFGQLLGMCDYVSFPLGGMGYNVFKYVPYGPIRTVVPYLTRRAVENGDVVGRAGKERAMLRAALLKRLFFTF
jgi:hypothetical protein